LSEGDHDRCVIDQEAPLLYELYLGEVEVRQVVARRGKLVVLVSSPILLAVVGLNQLVVKRKVTISEYFAFYHSWYSVESRDLA